MRTLIITAALTALFLSPAFASGTGIGKGNQSTTPDTTLPQTPVNPCLQGEIYDATRNLCIRPNGEAYTPVPR